MQGKTMHDEVNSMLARIVAGAEGEDQEPEQGIHAGEEPVPLQDIYVYIVREHDEEPDQLSADGVVETTLARQKPPLRAIAMWFFALLLPLSSIAFQLYVTFHPFIATITILPKSQQVTLSGSMQLGRLLNPITLSDSQTVPTTGTGHQNAKAAAGFITFYNGQFTSVTIPAGILITSASGIQIITDQVASIPAGNPPTYGKVTVSAHSLLFGTRGNLPAYTINQACCANAVLATNTSAFTGGQDERSFQTVAKADIANAASPLTTTLSARSTAVLYGQLQPGEKLLPLPCSRTISPDHQVGQEATLVTVTVSETCRAVAYSSTQLQSKALQRATSKALTHLGTGYRLRGDFTVTVMKAVTTRPTPILMFSSQSTWVYVLSAKEQERIKALLAGKTKQDAPKLLAALPGIRSVAMQWDENTKLPKDPKYIHLVLLDKPAGRQLLAPSRTDR